MSNEHDPGGKRLLALPEGTEGVAIFGGDRNEYRYVLARVWDKTLPAVLFVMMNPSTADPNYDDPTVAKCGRFARKWGYGRLFVGNTFAYRCTDQSRLVETFDPVGPRNDLFLASMAKKADKVIFAFGKPKHKQLRGRGFSVARQIAALGKHPHALRLSTDNTPWHPLYLPEETTVPFPWSFE